MPSPEASPEATLAAILPRTAARCPQPTEASVRVVTCLRKCGIGPEAFAAAPGTCEPAPDIAPRDPRAITLPEHLVA